MRGLKKIGMIGLMGLMTIIEIPVSVVALVFTLAEVLIDMVMTKLVLAVGDHKYVVAHRESINSSRALHGEIVTIYEELSELEGS